MYLPYNPTYIKKPHKANKRGETEISCTYKIQNKIKIKYTQTHTFLHVHIRKVIMKHC